MQCNAFGHSTSKRLNRVFFNDFVAFIPYLSNTNGIVSKILFAFVFRESSVRYYYDRYERQCTTYTFGGCEASDNDFDTLEDCQQTCNVTEKMECDLECDYGYKTDDNGQEICECACARWMCRMGCRHGFQINEHGCEVCRCNEPCMVINNY